MQNVYLRAAQINLALNYISHSLSTICILNFSPNAECVLLYFDAMHYIAVFLRTGIRFAIGWNGPIMHEQHTQGIVYVLHLAFISNGDLVEFIQYKLQGTQCIHHFQLQWACCLCCCWSSISGNEFHSFNQCLICITHAIFEYCKMN